MALLKYFKNVDGNYPGTNVPDPQWAFVKKYPRLQYQQQTPKLQLSAASVNAVRKMYLLISTGCDIYSVEQTVCSIARSSGEGSVLYTTKIPAPLTNSGFGILSSSCIHEIILLKLNAATCIHKFRPTNNYTCKHYTVVRLDVYHANRKKEYDKCMANKLCVFKAKYMYNCYFP